MNRAQLIREMSDTLFIDQESCAKMLDCMSNIICRELGAGGEVKIAGFGTFDVLTRKSRAFRNPQDGCIMQAPEKACPRFKPGKMLAEQVARLADCGSSKK